MIKSVLPVFLVFSTSFGGVVENSSPRDIAYSFTSQIDPVADSPSLIAQEIPAIQEEGFVFEFLGCETRPNTDVPLTCEFMIENSQELERTLTMYGGQGGYELSRIIDTSGNEIPASYAQIGRYSGRKASANLPSSIPLKASLSFSEAPEGGIMILDMELHGEGSGYFDVEFRFAR